MQILSVLRQIIPKESYQFTQMGIPLHHTKAVQLKYEVEQTETNVDLPVWLWVVNPARGKAWRRYKFKKIKILLFCNATPPC